MTNQNAIKHIKKTITYGLCPPYNLCPNCKLRNKALSLAIKALKGVSREELEKILPEEITFIDRTHPVRLQCSKDDWNSGFNHARSVCLESLLKHYGG